VYSFVLDILAVVAASDLVHAAISGRYVSIGRGGTKKVTPVKSARVRTILAVLASVILGFVVWDVKKKLGVCLSSTGRGTRLEVRGQVRGRTGRLPRSSLPFERYLFVNYRP
jgi:hypothetical protein